MLKLPELHKTSGVIKRKKHINWLFYLLPIPGVIFLIMFRYLPMAGLYIVFERYTYQGGLFGSEFVGFDNFVFFFRNMNNALRAMRNTLVINIASILLGMVANVSLAIAVNEIKAARYRKITQSVLLFPNFISWVVVGAVFNVLLSESSGIVNELLINAGMNPVDWYSNPWYWWPILAYANVWKSAGYGSLIYFSALTAFDQSLYEASAIDGASKWQQIVKITIPQLKPTMIIMFLLSIGGIMSGDISMTMGMTNLNPILFETTDTISTFVYRSALANGNFECGSAITLFESIFGFCFVMLSNWLVKKAEPDYALF